MNPTQMGAPDFGAECMQRPCARQAPRLNILWRIFPRRWLLLPERKPRHGATVSRRGAESAEEGAERRDRVCDRTHGIHRMRICLTDPVARVHHPRGRAEFTHGDHGGHGEEKDEAKEDRTRAPNQSCRSPCSVCCAGLLCNSSHPCQRRSRAPAWIGFGTIFSPAPCSPKADKSQTALGQKGLLWTQRSVSLPGSRNRRWQRLLYDESGGLSLAECPEFSRLLLRNAA